MDDKNKSQASRPRRPVPAAWPALGALVVFSLAGCADHRITLAQFQDMQRESDQAPEAPSPEAALEARALLDRQLGPYRVGPQDVLNVVVSRLEQDSVLPSFQARVDRNGEIDLPTVGKIKVAGLQLQDVENAIHQVFVPGVFNDASVYVSLQEYDTTNVLVTGAVADPGLVRLRRTERNLLFALVEAGGVSEMASGKVTLQRIRRPAEQLTLNLTEPQELRAALALEPLEHGDIISVEAATPNTVYVGGLVNAPSPQSFMQGVKVTVLQVLASSGGIRTDVTPREATLIRRLPDGTDVHVKLDLERINTGKDPNILLAGGDILWVPETIETKVQDWVNHNIFIRAGVNANVSYNVTGIEYLNRRSLQTGGAGAGSSLQDQFDPFGFLQRNAMLQALPTTP